METLLDSGISVDSISEHPHSRDMHSSPTNSRRMYALLCTSIPANINADVQDSVPLLRALIRRGANLYAPLNDNETMVHYLFTFPEQEILDALLEEPCLSLIDLNRRDQHGRTVLMASCDWREVLAGYGYRRSEPKAFAPPLRILDYGADATLVDNDGKTPLHHLLDNPGMPDDVLIQFINREEVAPTLSSKDKDGYSPFHYSLRILRPAVCEVLLSKGSSILDPDPNGLTALHYIASQWYASRRSLNSIGGLPQDLPSDHFDRCLALWQRFIAERGSINARDNAGNTPLHAYLLSPVTDDHTKSTYKCHLERYDALFPPDSGVDIFAMNHEGETALHMIARREGHAREGHDMRLFEAMMGRGLDPTKEDYRARSALDVASACGKDDIVALLRRT